MCPLKLLDVIYPPQTAVTCVVQIMFSLPASRCHFCMIHVGIGTSHHWSTCVDGGSCVMLPAPCAAHDPAQLDTYILSGCPTALSQECYGSTYSISNPTSPADGSMLYTDLPRLMISYRDSDNPHATVPIFLYTIDQSQPDPMWPSYLCTGQPCHTPRAHSLNKHPKWP